MIFLCETNCNCTGLSRRGDSGHLWNLPTRHLAHLQVYTPYSAPGGGRHQTTQINLLRHPMILLGSPYISI